MAINVTITDPQTDEDQKRSEAGKSQVSMELNMRKRADGSIMIFDHDDIDIVILPEKSKVIALPKELLTDEVYETQNQLFRHLSKKGIIEYDSVRGGSVYGAMQAVIQKSVFEGANPLQLAIFQIGKFIEDERPYFESEKAYFEREEEKLLEPGQEDSTELGEVPHEETKGSLRPGWVRGPYGIYDMYRV